MEIRNQYLKKGYHGKMKRLALLLFILMVFTLMAVSAIAAPRLTIPESSFNFGYVPQHSKISHKFMLESTGDDTLKIVKVVPGWGCTQAPLEKDVLAVGDSTSLEIIFSTKTYSNRVTKRPRIVTNEGQPDKNVQIIAHVVSRPDSTYPVVIDPYKLDLSQFTSKVRDKIDFTINNVSDVELHPSLVYMPKDLFELQLPDKIAPGAKGEAVLKLKKDAIDQSFEKSITIQFDDEKESRFTIPVKRTVRVAGNPGAQQTGAKGGK